MAANVRKNKAKSSTASRAKKIKSKVKITKVDRKIKKSTAKVKKNKKITKPKQAKVISKKAAPVKTKAKAKIAAKITPIKTIKIKALPKTTKPKIKVKATEPFVTKISRNIAVMQPYVAPQITPSSTTKTTGFYMNTKQLEYFRNLLEQWKRELMEEVDHTIVEMKEAGMPADPNDCATQEETFNLELRTRDRERKLLKKIEEALQKIDNEEYGYCESCGIEIGIGRLEARPTATLCIDCKTLDEIKEKRSQDG